MLLEQNSAVAESMFLLVSSRHAGAHLDGHQHDFSIQIFNIQI